MQGFTDFRSEHARLGLLPIQGGRSAASSVQTGAGNLCARVFTYDEENRLTGVFRVEDGVAGDPILRIAYDALGRRVLSEDDHDYAATISPDCAVEETPVAMRHVHSGIEVVAEYQANGGTGGSVGLAPTVGTVSLPTSGVPTGSPPATLPAGWDLAREFLWGERFPEPLAMIDFTDAGSRPRPGVTTGGVTGGAETLYYHHDALGSVVALTDAGDPEASPDPIPGKIVERYTYDPYGRTVIETWDQSLGGGSGGFVVRGSGLTAIGSAGGSHFGNPFAWTGQRYDAGVGLYHFLFRSYSPEFGRWLQRDPAGYVDGPNLLEYVTSKPSALVDPLGLLYSPPDPSPYTSKINQTCHIWIYLPADRSDPGTLIAYGADGQSIFSAPVRGQGARTKGKSKPGTETNGDTPTGDYPATREGPQTPRDTYGPNGVIRLTGREGRYDDHPAMSGESLVNKRCGILIHGGRAGWIRQKNGVIVNIARRTIQKGLVSCPGNTLGCVRMVDADLLTGTYNI
ncbi:MAG: RHS repeat-associated core domain-containing protein [Phycisphaerales bacterium]|nr:RHS repeat-associated core domain-containing protein [Phycisphaerales bacterium]